MGDGDGAGALCSLNLAIAQPRTIKRLYRGVVIEPRHPDKRRHRDIRRRPRRTKRIARTTNDERRTTTPPPIFTSDLATPQRSGKPGVFLLNPPLGPRRAPRVLVCFWCSAPRVLVFLVFLAFWVFLESPGSRKYLAGLRRVCVVKPARPSRSSAWPGYEFLYAAIRLRRRPRSACTKRDGGELAN